MLKVASKVVSGQLGLFKCADKLENVLYCGQSDQGLKVGALVERELGFWITGMHMLGQGVSSTNLCVDINSLPHLNSF
jgi:hypothetical protein